MIVDSSATAVAYLWATTPILGMEALPIYSDDEFKLPAAPWFVALNGCSSNGCTPSIPMSSCVIQ